MNAADEDQVRALDLHIDHHARFASVFAFVQWDDAALAAIRRRRFQPRQHAVGQGVALVENSAGGVEQYLLADSSRRP